MSGEQRREKMLNVLRTAGHPVPGAKLAQMFAVSRQVVVQDVALLRAEKQEIISTCRGYMMRQDLPCQRIFKVRHSDEEMEEELNLYVDFGGTVEDEFVYHRIYNVIRVEMGLKSRREIKDYMEKLKSGRSKSLKDVTSGFHYHTVTAESEEILVQIQKELQEKGFLAELRDYEPIDFWKEENYTKG